MGGGRSWKISRSRVKSQLFLAPHHYTFPHISTHGRDDVVAVVIAGFDLVIDKNSTYK